MAIESAPYIAQFTGYLLRRAFAKSAGVARECIPVDSHIREVAVLAILAERGSVSQREIADITHVNLNDQTLEGFRHRNEPVFCVQYHPEASPGPHDSHYLFDDFMKLMREQRT